VLLAMTGISSTVMYSLAAGGLEGDFLAMMVPFTLVLVARS